jgi:hypothetical protein
LKEVVKIRVATFLSVFRPISNFWTNQAPGKVQQEFKESITNA